MCIRDSHVGMAEHCPETGFIVHRLPVHRIRTTQGGKGFVRDTLGEGVRIGQVDRTCECAAHRQASSTLGCGTPACSHRLRYTARVLAPSETLSTSPSASRLRFAP